MSGGQAPPRADHTQPLERSEQPFRALNIDLADPQDRLFADYELLEKIAGGGMGVVYRARQLSLDREVALKLLAYDPFAAEDMVARFRDEARHAGRLQHPNIIPVFEIGTHENLYYFSMGLVRGPTLGRWLREPGERSPRALAQLLRLIAEAVEYAHQVGILHLDLKPGNVLIDERGAPQVGDFGLAHGIQEARAGGVKSAGTPNYMAPEQTQRGGSALTPRTDVWGLGAILCEMLTGEPPFPGTDMPDILRRVQSEPLVPPRQRNPQVPLDLDAICRHCLAKDPAERYASAREMADDLQRHVDGRPVSVRAQGWPERVRLWARREPRAAALSLGLLIALLVGLAATSVLWVQAEASRRLAQDTLWEARRGSALQAEVRGDPLAELPALVANVAEAEALGSAGDAARDRLRIGLLLAQAPRQIAGWEFASEGRSVAFAEDGQLLLAGLREGALVAIDTVTGAERWRTTPSFPPTPWGPSYVGRIVPTADGVHALLHASGSSGVARPDVSHMHRIDLRSGALLEPPPAFADLDGISFAHDGRSALLHDANGGWQRWTIDPWRAAGARFVRPATRYCLLCANGDAACSEAGFKRVSLLRADSGEVRAEFGFPSGAELTAWNGSADGRWLALGSGVGELLLVELETGIAAAIPEAGEDAVGDLAFTPTTLTVSSNGGSIRLYDLERRAWLTRALRSGSQRVNSAQFDQASQRLLATDGRAVFWRVPATSDQTSVLLRESVLRHRGALLGMHATALHGPRGLAASFGSEGELKLLRLPHDPLQAPVRALTAASADLIADVPELEAHASKPASTEEGFANLELAYLRQASADGRHQIAAIGADLWVVEPSSGTSRRIPLPNSAQTLLAHPTRALALVASIEPAGPVRMRWRALDLDRGEWLSEPWFSDGLLDGVRLDRAGLRMVWWQGQRAEVRRIDDGHVLGVVELPATSSQSITDISLFGAADRLLLATSQSSMRQPGSLQQWLIRAEGKATLLREVGTPTGHNRVFDLGTSWFAHGPRVAIYREQGRIELDDLGGDWSEAGAVSADGRWAAVAHRDSVRLYDLQFAQPLVAAQRLSMPAADLLSALAFSADGRTQFARTHFGTRFRLPFAVDARPLSQLRSEVADLAPDRTGEVAPTPNRERGLRDPGPPQAAIASPDWQRLRPAGASVAQIDLRPYANVQPGQRFQGSRRGLGITDSAAWPQGLLRLRGIDFDLGPASQLVPAGSSLGAAVFPERSGAIVLPPATRTLHLLLANQIDPRPGGLELHWLDATGATLAQASLDIPTAWDSGLHRPERGNQPLGDVGLIVRTAESRTGGGGSPHLFVYVVSVDAPKDVAGIAAFELRAPGSAPLLLGASVAPALGPSGSR